MYKKDISQEAKINKSPINSLIQRYHPTKLKALAAILQHAGLRTHLCFNQSQLGKHLGRRRERANEITTEFHNDGLVTKHYRGVKKQCLYIIDPILQNPTVKSALIRYVRGLKVLELAALMYDRTLNNIKGIIYKKSTDFGELPTSVGRWILRSKEHYSNEQLTWPPGTLENMPHTNKLTAEEWDTIWYSSSQNVVLKTSLQNGNDATGRAFYARYECNVKKKEYEDVQVSTECEWTIPVGCPTTDGLPGIGSQVRSSSDTFEEGYTASGELPDWDMQATSSQEWIEDNIFVV
jgi:hypothetical protein